MHKYKFDKATYSEQPQLCDPLQALVALGPRSQIGNHCGGQNCSKRVPLLPAARYIGNHHHGCETVALTDHLRNNRWRRC